MGTTIKEVARQAGVSIATVSRVFNHSNVVEEDTRARVHAAAVALQYVPNPIGRSLSRQRTEAIGLVLPDLFGEFFSEVIRGADETAQQHGYHLLVSSSHSSRQEIASALKTMRGRVDALVVMSPHIDVETIQSSLPQTLPFVLLNCGIHSNRFDSLSIDNFGGALSMTRHLLQHGHRRIAMIKGTEGNIDAMERLRGYVVALEEYDIPPDVALQAEGNFSESTGYEAVKKLLRLSPRPTAIFAGNDSMAIGALSALRDAGVRVPEDIALAGFDDVPIDAYLTPTLTSVRVDIHSLGVESITTVLDAVKKKNTHKKQQRQIHTELSLRQSCGCASQTNPSNNRIEKEVNNPSVLDS